MSKGKLRHIRIEPAKNGALLHVERDPDKKQKGPFLYDSGTEKHVHSSAEEAGEHVTKLLKEHGIGKTAGSKRTGSVGDHMEKY